MDGKLHLDDTTVLLVPLNSTAPGTPTAYIT